MFLSHQAELERNTKRKVLSRRMPSKKVLEADRANLFLTPHSLL
jgi:hypothetical protein